MPVRHFYLLRHHIILYKISAFLFVGSRRNQDIRWNPYLPYLEYKIAGRIYAANVMDAGLNQNNFYNATVYYEYTANHKHTFVTYTYTYTNSCTEPGERVTKCKDCGYIQLKQTLPAQGHDWEVVSEKKATCKAEGLRNLKLKKNQTVTLKAAAAPLTSIQKLKYKSSNKKIVTVTSKGVVKAKKKGKAVITVQSGSKTVKCKVTVK